MGHLRRWWQNLTGQPDEKKKAPPAATGRAKAGPAEDELTLADDQQPRQRSRLRGAGFDPYANDAGFEKPHSWDRVGRK